MWKRAFAESPCTKGARSPVEAVVDLRGCRELSFERARRGVDINPRTRYGLPWRRFSPLRVIGRPADGTEHATVDLDRKSASKCEGTAVARAVDTKRDSPNWKRSYDRSVGSPPKSKRRRETGYTPTVPIVLVIV